MATSPSDPSRPSTARRAAQVIIVGSVMFTFISFWKTAAVVLCDLASTAYYIGGIAEQAIGPAAPWFILAVMVFSYAVRNVYIESCSMFVRGGVYKVVRSAMGGFMGKLSVSALIFDYILTGPISSVSAGQYFFGWLIELGKYFGMRELSTDTADTIKQSGAVVFAVAVTLYFYRLNIKGIHESSDRAFKIMIATTIMAVVVLGWSGLTLAVKGPENSVPLTPDFQTKMNYDSKQMTDPLGFISKTGLGDNLRDLSKVKYLGTITDEGQEKLRFETRDRKLKNLPRSPKLAVQVDGKEAQLTDLAVGASVWLVEDDIGVAGITTTSSRPVNWFGVIGLLGIIVAFGHSILAMSGEETLAQVYREVEAPKLKNFRKAAFVVFMYSLALTSLISFLAVLLIPDEVRMKVYSSNLIGGLSMYLIGPHWARLLLNAFVVCIGALILSGAVNTAIIGSNGVLNRVAEDGVLPDWLLKPHPRYGTTYRVLTLILILKIVTIIASRGDVLLLGEAYAFGVVWSFVFMSASMVILRFKDKRPREYRMPLNVRFGGVEVPLGLVAVFLCLISAAIFNLMTKEIATVAGVAFTAAFLLVFILSERLRRTPVAKHGEEHTHVEQFTLETNVEGALTPAGLGLEPKPYLKLVAIRSTQNLFMLEKALAETDPDTTNVVVMTAKVLPAGVTEMEPGLDRYEQQLMTAVVDRADKAGKQVKPLIVPTNNPLNAVLQTARDLKAQEVVMGASNKYATDEQLEEIEFNWLVVNGGNVIPLSVRILGRDRDVHLDIGGGNRIPRISERRAKSVAELRAAGVGVSRVLMFHDGTVRCSDLFRTALTMLDPQVALTLATPGEPSAIVRRDEQQGDQLGRPVGVVRLDGNPADALVRTAKDGSYNLIVVMASEVVGVDVNAIVRTANCPVFVASFPAIPTDSVSD